MKATCATHGETEFTAPNQNGDSFCAACLQEGFDRLAPPGTGTKVPRQVTFDQDGRGGRLARQVIGRIQLFAEIEEERARQDRQWGGPGHDDEHDWDEWLDYIAKQMRRLDVDERRTLRRLEPPDAPPDYRDRLVKIAALAVAAVESHDRKAAR